MTQYVDKFKMSSGTYPLKDSEGRELIEQNKQEIKAAVTHIDKELATFMDDVNNKFAKLKDKKFILMTDSYGVDESVGGSSFSTLLESMIPKSIYAYNWSVGGAGFGWDYSKQEAFINIFNSNTSSWTQDEKNSITDLYVFGGANDGNLLHASLATDEDIRNKLDEFLVRVRSVLPNCTIHLGFIGWYRKLERFTYYNQAFHIWADGNCDFINNLNWLCIIKTLLVLPIISTQTRPRVSILLNIFIRQFYMVQLITLKLLAIIRRKVIAVLMGIA